MKRKILTTAVIMAVLAIMAVLGTNILHAGSNPQVKLASARYIGYYGRYSTQYLEGYIQVNNVAFEKNVVVHYTTNNKDWQDAPAKFVKAGKDGNEVWRFQTAYKSYDPNTKYVFAIKYETNGQVVWDNNNGQNYTVDGSKLSYNSGVSIFGDTPAILNSAYAYQDSVTGTICVKNMGFEKDIKVRYSTDEWKTFKELPANFTSTYDDKGEFWQFTIPGISDGKKVDFAISYEVNGATYWDNNFGANYSITNPGYITY